MAQSQVFSLGSAVLTLVVAAIGLIGVLTGAYVLDRNQRKHWIVDNKRSEYRKLLSTLTRTFLIVVRLHAPGMGIESEERRKVFVMEVEALATIRDRLFISKEIEELDVLRRWNAAMRNYDRTRDYDRFADDFGWIAADIKKKAGDLFKEEDWMGWLNESNFIRTMDDMQNPQRP